MLNNKIDLRLDLDVHCNLRCRYCDNPGLSSDLKIALPLEQVEELFKSAEKKCWSLFLSCAGEPLLNSKFPQIMELLSRHVHTPDVSMVTNALLLNERNRLEILKSSLNRLFISMDSLAPEIYTKWCGVSVEQFQKIVSQIEAFAKERQQQKKKPHLIITAIAMKDTLDGLPDIARWLVSLKASAFNIQWLNSMEHDYLEKEQLDLNDPETREHINRVLNEVKQILKGSGVLLDYPRAIGTEKLKSVWNNRKLWKNKFHYLFDAAKKFLFKYRKMPCRFAMNTFYLWPDGHLKGCPADGFDTKNIFEPGNALDSEILNVKNAIAQKKFSKCRGCIYTRE